MFKGMGSLKLGLPAQAILLALLFTPVFVQAQSRIVASETKGLNFKPMAQEEARASGFFPTLQTPAKPVAPSGPASVVPVQQASQKPAKNASPTDNKGMEMMQQLLSAMSGTGRGSNNGLPNRDTNFDDYQYDDDHIFNSGQKGAGNIGNGLCTAKNENRTQVKNGYCQMLNELLNDQGSCANREMRNILAQAGSDGSGFGELRQYCSTWGSLTDETQRTLVFVQILSGLITQESGWRADATEPQWYKNGKPMGGKGLFQIGVDDRGKDADCAGINERSIYDPKTNMKCGACLALKYAAMDKTMGHGVGDDPKAPNGGVGMARYFGPFRDGQRKKREAIAAGANSYCVASTSGGDGGQMRAAVDGAPQRSAASAK